MIRWTICEEFLKLYFLFVSHTYAFHRSSANPAILKKFFFFDVVVLLHHSHTIDDNKKMKRREKWKIEGWRYAKSNKFDFSSFHRRRREYFFICRLRAVQDWLDLMFMQSMKNYSVMVQHLSYFFNIFPIPGSIRAEKCNFIVANDRKNTQNN